MKFETLNEWLSWQESLHPNEIELGLERVSEVWRKLHDQPLSCPVITVAGTNGKGSCIAFLDAILRAGGYRTGVYTSPHLLRYNERVRLDGVEAADEQLCDAFSRVDAARGDTSLTYFEFATLAALDIFNRSQLDVIILEVGLGGRLDAVNIIDADVSVITTIDLDHTDWLGDTKEKIGREKAGIARPGRPLVLGQKEMPDSVYEIAKALQAEPFAIGEHFSYQRGEDSWDWCSISKRRNALPFPYLRGDFQLINASTALMVLELLGDRLPLDQRAVRIGMQEAALAGRFQITGRDPLIILDVGHNVQAMQTLSSNLGNHYCAGKTLAVFSMLSDKMIAESLAVIKHRMDEWYVGRSSSHRSESGEQLNTQLQALGIETDRIHVSETVKSAFESAKAAAQPEDRIVVFGSFFTVSDIFELV